MNNCLQCNINRMLGLSSFSHKKILSFDKIKTKVFADKKHNMHWIRKYVSPYYEFAKSSSLNDWQIYSLIDSRYFEELTRFIEIKKLNKKIKKSENIIRHSFDEDHFFISNKINEGRNNIYSYIFVDKKGKQLVLISKAYKHELDYLLARNIRTVFNLESLLRGDLHLHASAVSANGKGYIFVGNKNQGKTYSMLAACSGGVLDYVSNDHSIVTKKGNIFGSPTSVGIRYNTLKQCPNFSKYFKNKEPEYIFQKQDPKDKKRYFLVNELVIILKTKIVKSMSPSAIIFPCYSNNKIINLEKIVKQEFVLNIQSLIINDPCEHVPVWREFFADDLKKIKQEQQTGLGRLLKNVPIYKMHTNLVNMGFIAKELLRLSSEELSEYTYNKARVFAKDRYAGIKRKDDKSMFSHVQAVVEILKKHKIYNKYILTIAYLHDILEETITSKKEVEDNFGTQILKDILSLTVIKRDKESYDSQFRRMLKKLQLASNEVLIVKLVDRMHNLECMTRNSRYFKKEKIERYKISTKKLVIELFQKKIKHEKLILEILDLCK